MPEVSRQQAIETLEEGRRRLDGLLSGVPHDDLVRPATIGGGEWSAKDLIGQIDGMTDEEWSSKVRYETERRWTAASLLGSITGAPQRPFGHAFAHIPDLEAFVSSLRG